MNISLITSDTVELLSRITGQKLSQRDITPPVIFLASLVAVLVGVIFVDGTVAEEEKRRLLTILYKFSQPDSDLRRLTHLMIKGVKENQTYRKINELLMLTSSFSPSEKLLLIAFGYEISAADGEMDVKEKKYLQIIAQQLGIKSQYLKVLETGFTQQGNLDFNAVNEVHFLLEPSRFQELDAVFVKAASDMLANLPSQAESNFGKHHKNLTYQQLTNFQTQRKQLDNYCEWIFQIIQECHEQNFLPHNLIDDVNQIFEKVKSQKFRITVIGEFSQGKSTLLNALLGEEIQPVRAVPCSGAVTVLKYGTNKRVTCHYKDGRTEEIPFEQYKTKAAISKEAALDHRTDELAKSDIEEIIFEHPNLEICKSGVEIVDSPGLNEHPERTYITYKLLKDVDAAIFLTNAMRLLPEKEKELIQDVRVQLNKGDKTAPAENLFVLVNFIDILDNEEDLQNVKERLENFLKKEKLIINTGLNRIHYISAKASLKSILNGSNDEYLQTFQTFSQSLEQFLVMERGRIAINRSVNEINSFIIKSLDVLNLADEALDGKIQFSESAKQGILERIGDAGGRDVKIRSLASKLKREVYDKSIESWYKWHEGLGDRMATKIQAWTSEHNPVLSQNKLIQDYSNQFIRDLSIEIDEWGDKILKENILKEKIEYLDNYITYELEAIQSEFGKLSQQVNTDFSRQINLSIDGISDNFSGFGGIGGGIGIGGALAAALFTFTGLGLIAVIVAGVVAAIASSFGLGLLDVDGLKDDIKQKVFDIGFKKFNESKSKIHEKLQEIINTVFDSRVESASKVISQAISLYENLLEQEEKAHQATLEEKETQKAWIEQKRQALTQIQTELSRMANVAS
ncbi:MAG TPA: dynamin family protein [Nostocaceae cyanobacterium]|nr:dynamin family protein [Nostocaceae cyanobacterium]